MSPFTLLLALLSSMTLQLESDGSSFLETPDSLWIVPGTVTAVAGGDTLDASPGTSGSRTGILLSPPPPSGTLVTVSFDTLDLDVPSSVSLEVGFAERQVLEQLPEYEADPVLDRGLYISGSKRIGFSVGEGGGLDQGTRIAVEGTAAPGITVSGSVTDRNLASGPYSSELVSQLDRIFFLVDGGTWQARLGDMEWVAGREDTGPFSWRREVSGIDVSAEVGENYTAGAGYGTSGDTRQRTVFYTREGIQGPYQVTSGWEVVPGSEKVWLDGRLLSRGATEDYRMEYTAGLITFTSSRLIRNDQRVEITFFQRGDGFRKDFIKGSGTYSQGGLTMELTGFFSEDDRNSPLGFVLTDEAVEVLAGAGEDPAEAWIDGATYEGEGEGDYSLDSLGHWVYRGPDQGEWTVVFGRPPEGPGDYIYDSSLGGYLWAGEGQGTHFPRQYVQIPAGYRTGGISLDYGEDLLDLGLEAAFSGRTGNMFNPEETTRQGIFISAGGRMDFWEDGPGLGLGGRLASGGYRPPDELESDSSLAAWSLPPGYSGNDELVLADIGSDELSVSGAGRFLERGGTIERYRISSRPRVAGIGVSAMASFLKRQGTDSLARGKTSSLTLSGTPLSGTLKPFAGGGLASESWQDSLSGDVRTGFTGLSYDSGTIEALLRLELQRDTRTGDAGAGPFTVWRARLEGAGPAGDLRYRGSIEHSATSYDMGGTLEADALNITFTGVTGGVWSETVYNGSGTVSSSLDVIYVFAGEGEGDYSYDPESGQYYPDPDGDYVVSYQPGTQGETVTSASLENTISYAGPSAGLSSLLRISSSSAEDRSRALLLYGAFDSENEGGYSIDLSPWFRWSEGLLTRLSFTGKLSDQRISYSGAGLRRQRGWSLRASPELTPSPDLVIDMYGRVWREEEELYSPRDTRGVRLEVDPVLEVLPGLKPGMVAAWESRREVITDLSKYMLEAGSHISGSGGGLPATARVTAGYIPGEGDLPAWFFDGSDPGVSWRASGRIGRSMASGLDISLFYWGRRPAGSQWSQRAGLEGTVNF